MLIFDAHLDLAWNAIDWNRDLRLSCEDIRAHENDLGLTDKGRGCNTVSLPDLRRGKVGIVICQSPCCMVCRMPRFAKLGSFVSSIESKTAPAGTPAPWPFRRTAGDCSSPT